jgi:hypothetical protein
MGTPYAGADSFPGTVTVLDDGDPPEAATWAPALEGLADRTKYLLNRMMGSVADWNHRAATPAAESTLIEALDTSGLYVPVTHADGEMSLGASEALDFILCGLHMKIRHTDAGAGDLGVRLARNGTAIPGAVSARLTSAQNDEHYFSLFAAITVGSPEADELIAIETYASGITSEWRGSYTFWGVRLRFLNP